MSRTVTFVKTFNSSCSALEVITSASWTLESTVTMITFIRLLGTLISTASANRLPVSIVGAMRVAS